MNQVDLLSLKAFVAVAREGTVSKAADTLHLTQPAVSLQLKAMQERLGLQLFARSGRGLALTRDGAALLPQAEKVLQALQDFSQSANNLHASTRGQLRIGTILDPEFTRLGAFLKELVEAAPQIETELSQHMSGDVLARLQQGALDVGFYLAMPHELVQLREATAVATPSVNPYFYEGNMAIAGMESAQNAMNLVVIELARFNYRVLAPSGWGTQVLGKDWRALAQLPWITTPAASAHHRLLQSVMQPLGLQLKRAALVDQEASMLDLVRSGVGLSLARDTVALREAQSRGLVVADRVQLECCLCFIHSATQRDAPVIQAARAALTKVWS
ncbi:LysR family transcriptional regulator [Variovorax sp. PCZ-1]|uniref:LysR family transcriptional regulator n=1 Tax=Variovorax sp. PCZ-1 TaxID=2835533 RepID=UPI001BCA69B3|nr:LysR family transcriptional regulator [Variovorax sp. PCZ-1]MBS7809125.1 LysR family transcriptional regulator [Variovorax sp. PCZ-1]